jgi:hypothetical protein
MIGYTPAHSTYFHLSGDNALSIYYGGKMFWTSAVERIEYILCSIHSVPYVLQFFSLLNKIYIYYLNAILEWMHSNCNAMGTFPNFL